MHRLCLIVTAFSLSASAWAHETPSPPPLEAFARLPAISNPQLSPDGKHLAYLAARAGTRVIVVRPLLVDGPGAEQVIAPDKGELISFSFAKNDRILMNIRAAGEQVVGSTRIGGGVWIDQKLKEVQRLASVDLRGNDVHMLTPVNNTADVLRLNFGGLIMHPLPDNPDEVVLQVQEDPTTGPSLVRANVRTGERTTIQKPLPQVFYWTVGPDGMAVAGLRVRDEQDIVLMRGKGGDWEEVAAHPMAAQDAMALTPISDTTDDVLVLAHPEGGTIGLYRFNGKDKRLSERIGDWPVDAVGTFAFGGVLAGVTLAGEMREQVLFDPTLRAIAAAVDKATPQTRETLIDMSRDGTMMLFASSGPRHPTSYMLFNAREKQLYPLGSSFPELNADGLARRSAVTYPARDGRAIPAIITLPPGIAPSNLPFIVLPHGGPTSHDDLSFHWLAQFLASRGYGVIQPNFRGSTGNGYDHRAAGRGQWGRAMQDDLVDAAGWLSGQQLADAKRICIVGASYGGYAAAVASFRDTDTFRCAASINGISELTQIYDGQRNNPRDDARDSLGGNRTALSEVSPLRQVDRIAMPLLLVHADKDTVVPVEHSERLATALKSAGKPHEYVVLEGGSHTLSYGKDRVTLLKALEKFLATHLNTPGTGG